MKPLTPTDRVESRESRVESKGERLTQHSALHRLGPAALGPRTQHSILTPAVLTIAGSDPSGGAGIQADLRVFAALGAAGLSAITALTVQNSRGVEAVHPVAADVLFDQIETILEDSPVRAVKIGMLGGADQVRAVAEALRRFQPPNVVLDPVLASTGGVPLLDEAGRAALIAELLPLCDLVTPNLEEASLLAGLPLEPEPSTGTVQRLAPSRLSTTPTGTMQRLGWLLREKGARNVLIKGGHLEGDPTDVLEDVMGASHFYKGVRVETPHTHGTGCLLSSIIAAYLAIDDSVPEMVGEAKSLLTFALWFPIVVGKGRGHPDIVAAARAYGEAGFRTHHERLHLLRGVYVLTDPDLRPDCSHEEIVEAALAGGAMVVQLRDKKLPALETIALAKRLAARVQAAGALFLVNDRVDVALASGADGVHLGPDDMHPADARRLLGPDRLVGVSVSTIEEARPLARYASYLGVGAIFGSRTKADAGPPVGVERIREIGAAFPDHPIVAIGGIDADNIAQVARAGAHAAAVVSAVVCAPDMQAATMDLLRRFRDAEPKGQG